MDREEFKVYITKVENVEYDPYIFVDCIHKSGVHYGQRVVTGEQDGVTFDDTVAHYMGKIIQSCYNKVKELNEHKKD